MPGLCSTKPRSTSPCMALASISHPIDEWGGGGGGRAGCAGLTRSVGFTVAILAQGTSWADAATQAFLQQRRILRTRCQLTFGIVHPTYSHPIVYEQLVTCVLQLLNPVPCIIVIQFCTTAIRVCTTTMLFFIAYYNHSLVYCNHSVVHYRCSIVYSGHSIPQRNH